MKMSEHEDDGHHSSPTLKYVILTAVLTTLITSLILLPIDIVKENVSQFIQRERRELNYTGLCYQLQSDTRFIPYTGIKFNKRDIRYFSIIISNDGNITEQNVRVSLKCFGTIQTLLKDHRVSVNNINNEPLNDFSSFRKKDDITFIIPKMPPGMKYKCVLITIPDDEKSAMPSPAYLTSVSDDSVGQWVQMSVDESNTEYYRFLYMISAIGGASDLETIEWKQ